MIENCHIRGFYLGVVNILERQQNIGELTCQPEIDNQSQVTNQDHFFFKKQFLNDHNSNLKNCDAKIFSYGESLEILID